MSTAGVQKHMAAAVDEARDTAMRGTRKVRREAGSLARDAIYAYVGAVDAGVQQAGRLARRAARLPQDTVQATLEIPARIRESFDSLADRGRRLVHRAERQASSSLNEVAERAAEATATNGQRGERSAAAHDSRPYEERTVDELYSLAVARDIEGRSTMNKEELIAALRG